MGNSVSYCDAEEVHVQEEERSFLTNTEGTGAPSLAESLAETERSGDGEDGDGEEDEEEDEEEGLTEAQLQALQDEIMSPEGKVQADYRFPATNQAKHCWARYSEFHKCVKETEDEEDPKCRWFQRAYEDLCPPDWKEKWDEQREEGVWPGKY